MFVIKEKNKLHHLSLNKIKVIFFKAFYWVLFVNLFVLESKIKYFCDFFSILSVCKKNVVPFFHFKAF